MRLEALNYSQLVREKDRINGAIPRVSEMAGGLGTDEGPQRYRYSGTQGLELLELIDRVGNLRFRMRSIALPALEERKQAVDKLIIGYPQRLQTAEERFFRMQEQAEKYTPEELSLAEQALLTAKREFQAPSIEELTAEAKALVPTPTPKPFKHLTIPDEDNIVRTIIAIEGTDSRLRRVELTPRESAVLLALARARVLENRRLQPAELAAGAFNQTASEVGLNKITAGLRAKLNLPGYLFIDTAGSTRGPGVQYGIAADVFVKAPGLEQERGRNDRLNKIKKLIFERKGTMQEAVFDQLVENFGKPVAMESGAAPQEKIYFLRTKLANITVDGYQYQIRTFRTRGRGLSYSLEEVRVSAPEEVEEISEADLRSGAALPPEDIAGKAEEDIRLAFPAPIEKKPKDPFAQIKRKDGGVVEKIKEIAAQIAETGTEVFIVPVIESLFGVPDHIVEKAIEDRKVNPKWYKGHHGMLLAAEAAFLIAQTEYRFNLTPKERKQLKQLAGEEVAAALKNREKRIGKR